MIRDFYNHTDIISNIFYQTSAVTMYIDLISSFTSCGFGIVVIMCIYSERLLNYNQLSSIFIILFYNLYTLLPPAFQHPLFHFFLKNFFQYWRTVQTLSEIPAFFAVIPHQVFRRYSLPINK